MACRVVQEREPDETEQQFTLQRFVPLLADVLEDLVAGKSSADEYIHVSAPRADAKPGEARCAFAEFEGLAPQLAG